MADEDVVGEDVADLGTTAEKTASDVSGGRSTVRIKRAYEQAQESDGYRVLVDRLWPRGVSKERAALDEWMKAIAPTPELRKWWGHDAERMSEFAHRYCAELDGNPAVDELSGIIARHPTVTLVYAAKDPKVNHAEILREYMAEHMYDTEPGCVDVGK
ncbi:MAG: DUF488 family protein [Bifidobacterium crudilactis]|jgi:uncharacterized protein YeaO (DUF488 family)|uniref:DUF488 family protein n=1 Tax=Bifidobacterium crudilactis TaxID=327277 RepID=A0A971CZQ0_9BIFI|nr:DUF488 family protein [Bifidobacterium crudilactis]NLT80129.1 DUF488 family protein [Bifidobacterium crudilactis]